MKAIGLMSGTSMDAIDVALIETDGDAITGFGPAQGFPYTEQERQLLRESMQSARGLSRRDDRSGVLGIAEQMITAKHVDALKTFLAVNSISLADVSIIGFHGQTVVHRPEQGLTVQLGNGEALAAAIGAPVVHDFRAADIEKGGQGAPLVPIYHWALALRAGLPRPAVFVNIGGISNVTFIPDGPAETLIAFDAGPGNCLLDDWAFRHTGVPIDRDARLALSGAVNLKALQALLNKPYFAAPPPKSLDRGFFSLEQLADLDPADGAATLTAFTVACIGAAARHFPEKAAIWVITGGGAQNPHMLEGLQRVLEPKVVTADGIGLNAEFMEAQAFAYLAARRLKSLPSSFKGTTGVETPTVAGVLRYP